MEKINLKQTLDLLQSCNPEKIIISEMIFGDQVCGYEYFSILVFNNKIELYSYITDNGTWECADDDDTASYPGDEVVFSLCDSHHKHHTLVKFTYKYCGYYYIFSNPTMYQEIFNHLETNSSNNPNNENNKKYKTDKIKEINKENNEQNEKNNYLNQSIFPDINLL